MITTRDDVFAIDRAYELGATSFVSKPVNWRLLGHQLRYVMRTSRMEAEIRAARDEARGAADLRQSLLALLQHETRTPLHGIIGFAELLKGADDPATRASMPHGRRRRELNDKLRRDLLLRPGSRPAASRSSPSRRRSSMSPTRRCGRCAAGGRREGDARGRGPQTSRRRRPATCATSAPRCRSCSPTPSPIRPAAAGSR